MHEHVAVEMQHTLVLRQSEYLSPTRTLKPHHHTSRRRLRWCSTWSFNISSMPQQPELSSRNINAQSSRQASDRLMRARKSCSVGRSSSCGGGDSAWGACRRRIGTPSLAGPCVGRGSQTPRAWEPACRSILAANRGRTRTHTTLVKPGSTSATSSIVHFDCANAYSNGAWHVPNMRVATCRADSPTTIAPSSTPDWRQSMIGPPARSRQCGNHCPRP